uniref:Major capsid protein n=1 Tax=Megaviridae environmental sample TaxID=1737588 RepID=A0A5J6VKZ3_9VIRU|nr:MAG: major capsid protein [Megaviridae environmental sample]
MTIGYIILQCTNSKNNMLSRGPTITFFKKCYVRHTNFSKETLPLYFNSSVDFGKQLSVNLSKNADLLSQITLKLILPNISKSTNTTLPHDIKKFKWINKIGLGIIKYIEIEVGGITIDRHYGDWLNIYYELFEGYNEDNQKTIGNNNKILNEYSSTKDNYSLYIPLKFFFNLFPKYYLPLLSISGQDVKLNIVLNKFEDCIKESPTHYFEVDETICLFQQNEYLYQNINLKKNIGKFVYFDTVNKRVYYEKVIGEFLIPTAQSIKSSYNIVGDKTKFNMIPKVNSIINRDEPFFNGNRPPLQDGFLLVNYVYLDHDERWYYQTNKLQYHVPLISTALDKTISNINYKYNFKLHNPTKALIWRFILKNNIEQNDIFNYSLFPLSNSDDNILISSKLYMNNVQISDITNVEFYNLLQNGTNYFYYNKFISSYSFSAISDYSDVHGTINLSKIQDMYLDIKLNKSINYQYPVNIRLYGLYYNIIEIDNGILSLKYTI